jgi:hypothetical protein
MVTNQTFSQDSENQPENLLGDMVQDAQELLLVTKANVGIS